VDDDDELRKALMKILEREGFRVIPQATANDAVQFLGSSSHKLDLVITDILMPGMRGTTFLTVLKTAYPDLPVIVITAFGDWGQYDEVLRGGACEYLNKPFDKEELLITVRHALAHPTTR
jgi:DNA-binding NtrC family response regulator